MKTSTSKSDFRVIWAVWLVFAALLAAGAQAALPDPNILQPAAFNVVGLNAVRGDIDLWGGNVGIGVVCRSLSYAQGVPANDYRPFLDHNCLQTGDIFCLDDGLYPAGQSPHASAICGILTGFDPYAGNELGEFYYLGALPEAAVDVYEFWHFVVDYLYTGRPVFADVLSLSLGSMVQDWWTRGFDAAVEYQNKVVVASIGNGSEAGDLVLYPGSGPNVIGVGVMPSVKALGPAGELAHFGLVDAGLSSMGPTEDSRCKPDVVAPGNCLVPDSADKGAYRTSGDGASYAAPIAAGVAGMMVDYVKSDPELADRFTAGPGMIVKSILMTSARKLPYWHKGAAGTEDDHSVPADYLQGAGMIDAAGAFKVLQSGQGGYGETAGWAAEGLEATAWAQRGYAIELPADGAKRVICATLTWDRHFEAEYPFDELPGQSDLRLELWALGAVNGAEDVLIDWCDSPGDNVEHLYAAADPNFTRFELMVRYSDRQDFEGLDRDSERFCVSWRVGPAPDKSDDRWYDLNGDGTVNFADMSRIFEYYGQGDLERILPGDINMNGRIDVRDVQMLLERIAPGM